MEKNNYDSYTDSQLIALVKENTRACDSAFQVLYNRYSTKLFSFCRFKTETKEDAEELSQETWIKFFQIIKKGSVNISLPSFLYKNATNLYTNKLNGNTIPINDKIFDIDRIADSIDIIKHIEDQDLNNIVKLCINSLPENYQNLLILKWYNGYNSTDISEIVDDKPDNIRQKCCNAMKKLLDTLKPIINEIKKYG